MTLKISLRAKAGVLKTLVKQKLPLHSPYFSQNTLMLTDSRREFSDLHSIFTLCASLLLLLVKGTQTHFCACFLRMRKILTFVTGGQEFKHVKINIELSLIHLHRP